MKGGFTLVELLIVITILAVLSAIGLTIYKSVLKSARDSNRKTDFGFIQSALEQYFADQFSYPAIDTGTTACPTNGSLNFTFQPSGQTGCPLKNPLGTKTYINVLPKDPLPSPQPKYCYSPVPSSPTPCSPSGTKCTSYTLYAKLENGPSPTYTCGGVTSGYNFQATPP